MTEDVNIYVENISENVSIAIETTEGKQGEQGIRGVDGLSAYEIAVENGYEGTEQEWLDSLVGGVSSVNGAVGVVVIDADDISDSTTLNKFVTLTEKSNIHASGSDAETASSIGALINGATAKDTPVDADMIGLMDSAATNVLKKFSWANIKSKLKDYFDTIYAAATHTHSYMTDLVNDTTPQLGGNLDLNGKCIDYGAIPTSNGTYVGEIITATVDANSTGFGAVLAIGTDGHFDEADADAIANCYRLALACETGTGSKKILLKGFMCNTAWSFNAGLPIYLSTTTGTLTQTEPTGTDDVKVIVAWAWTATTIELYAYPYFQTKV